jgi:hypothetical protein
MTRRHAFRLGAAASLLACAGFGAQAIDATQWEAEAPASLVAMSSTTEATLEPAAWTVGRGDATQFRDGMARDTLATRASVREDLRLARRHGLIDDTGEGGASDQVLAQRDAYNAAEQDRYLALNTPPEDPIADIASLASSVDATDGAPTYDIAADDMLLRVPSGQTPDAPLPDERSDVATVAIGPAYPDTEASLMPESVTVIR